MRSPPQLLPPSPWLTWRLPAPLRAYKVTRSCLARSLFRRCVGAGDALYEPRGGGTARVQRESMPPTYGCQRQGVYPSPSGNEARKPTEGVSPGQNEVQSVLSVLIFLERSPLGVRTCDLPHGLVYSRRSMMVSFAHLPPILPPTRANRDEYWRTAQWQKRRKIRH
jgi:hypothetical protein